MSNDLAKIQADVKSTEEPKPRRSKLRVYDLAPAQMLNEMTESGMRTIGLDELANVQRGAARLTSQSYATSDTVRKHLALSRLAEVQKKTAEKLTQKESDKVSVETYKDGKKSPCDDGAVSTLDD